MTRMLRLLVFALLVACGGSPNLDAGPLEHGPVEVRTALEGNVTARGGRFSVMVEQDADLEVAWPEVVPTRLEVEPDGDIREERVGGRLIRTRQYVFTGSKGSHVIPAVTATWQDDAGEHSASSQPLYVDLGVQAPRPGELADIPDPEAETGWPWLVIGTVLGLIALFAGGLFIAFRGDDEPELAAVPPEPPDVVALRAWEAVRESELGDFDKALAISRIFRDYAEDVLAFKATALTTTEILEKLRYMHHLEEGNVPRAKRLLRATDRIKFAEVSAKDDLFEELDSDLRAFVASTRPHQWTPEVDEAPVRRATRSSGGPAWAWWMLAANRAMAFGFFGGAAASLIAMFRFYNEAGGLPFAWFMGTFFFASGLLLLGGLHYVLATEATARRLRWVQILVTVPHLLFVPIGTVYALFVWAVLFGSRAGRDFYREAA